MSFFDSGVADDPRGRLPLPQKGDAMRSHPYCLFGEHLPVMVAEGASPRPAFVPAMWRRSITSPLVCSLPCPSWTRALEKVAPPSALQCCKDASIVGRRCVILLLRSRAEPTPGLSVALPLGFESAQLLPQHVNLSGFATR